MFEAELKELIEEYSDHKLTGTSEEIINEIEKTLNITLPDSYKWLIREYGSVSFDGFEIDGVGLNDVHISLENTLNWRDSNLPNEYVVIFEPGADWIYCLDTSQMNSGECTVVAWYQDNIKGEKEADNLYEFIKQQIELK